MTNSLYANANSLDLPIAARSVQMIATSPPYWGLRDYGVAGQLGAEHLHDCLAWARREPTCGQCYVCNMRSVGAEMWRVLRDDGVWFLNLGDSYAGGGFGGWQDGESRRGYGSTNKNKGRRHRLRQGLKSKDLAGIPWRAALALQSDGWYLRCDIIWSKPNSMPESVKDRPTKTHEYVFLLAKSERYYWDAEAVKEDVNYDGQGGGGRVLGGKNKANGIPHDHRRGGEWEGQNGGRNIRSVWTIATQPYPGSHFAVWPPALVERMIRAGSSARGVCPECGKSWVRILEKGLTAHDGSTATRYADGKNANSLARLRQAAKERGTEYSNSARTIRWQATCPHDLPPTPAVVLDPFVGSGTTIDVARQLGRIGLGFDLSETYLREDCRIRLGDDLLAAWNGGHGIMSNHNDHLGLPLFHGQPIQEDETP